jgi:lipopolysaccharide/colanic/teichoic acid biosynthesis glycosyltransferase
MVRLLDLVFSITAVIFLSPFYLLIAVIIKIDSAGPVFFIQERIGKNFKPFRLYKFRTMNNNFGEGSLITIGSRDQRITHIGYYLRRFKLDELPQLINVIKGDMSIVGPRPEVRKYVELYNEEQKRVLMVKPGITDYASIEFRNENELLSGIENPDEYYIKIIMPEKLKLNIQYLRDRSTRQYLRIIFLTIFRLFGSSGG